MDERNLPQAPLTDQPDNVESVAAVPIDALANESQQLAGQESNGDQQEDQQAESLDEDEDETSVTTQDETPEPGFTWQASEYVHHHKGVRWYIALAAAVLVLSVGAVLLKSWLSIGVFLAMGAAIAVYAQKPPRLLTYEIDSDSVTIEGKQYPYKNFRSFGVISDIEWHTIDLEPTQRFMPRLTVLFSDEDFDSIVDHLSLHLPRADREPDMVERITRYLRF